MATDSHDVQSLRISINENSKKLDTILQTLQGVQNLKVKVDNLDKKVDNIVSTKSEISNTSFKDDILFTMKENNLKLMAFVKQEVEDIGENLTLTLDRQFISNISQKCCESTGKRLADQVKRVTNVYSFGMTKVKNEITGLKKYLKTSAAYTVFTVSMWILVLSSLYDVNRSFNNQAITLANLQESLNTELGDRMTSVYKNTELYKDVGVINQSLVNLSTLHEQFNTSFISVKSTQEIHESIDTLTATVKELSKFNNVDKIMGYLESNTMSGKQTNIRLSHEGCPKNTMNMYFSIPSTLFTWVCNTMVFLLNLVAVSAFVCLILYGIITVQEAFWKNSFQNTEKEEEFCFMATTACHSLGLSVVVYCLGSEFFVSASTSYMNWVWSGLVFILVIGVTFLMVLGIILVLDILCDKVFNKSQHDSFMISLIITNVAICLFETVYMYFYANKFNSLFGWAYSIVAVVLIAAIACSFLVMGFVIVSKQIDEGFAALVVFACSSFILSCSVYFQISEYVVPESYTIYGWVSSFGIFIAIITLVSLSAYGAVSVVSGIVSKMNQSNTNKPDPKVISFTIVNICLSLLFAICAYNM